MTARPVQPGHGNHQSPSPALHETIRDAKHLAGILGYTEAEYVIVLEQQWRPWIITSNERGDLWAHSFLIDGEDQPYKRIDVLHYPLTLIYTPAANTPNDEAPAHPTPGARTWPDGTSVRFTQEALDAMDLPPHLGRLRRPAAGSRIADRVFTVRNTDDQLNDVILVEINERWGTLWLEEVHNER